MRGYYDLNVVPAIIFLCVLSAIAGGLLWELVKFILRHLHLVWA